MDDLKLMTALFRTKNNVEHAIVEDLKKHDITLNTFAVLEQLYHKGTSKIHEICERLLIPNSSMTYVIDQLEKKALVKRIYSKNDRRSINVELTLEGTKLITNIFPYHKDKVANIFSVLNDEEKEHLLSLLKKVSFSISK